MNSNFLFKLGLSVVLSLSLPSCSKGQKPSDAVKEAITEAPPLVTSEAGNIIKSALPLLSKYTDDEGASLKITKLLTEMAEQPDAMQRAALGAMINLISSSRELLVICINIDAIYTRVKDPKDRAIQIEVIKGNYLGCQKEKGRWNEFRPKLTQFEKVPSLKRLFDSYDEYISAYDKLVNARLNQPDLLWHRN